MRLSNNFRLSEFTRSDTAKRLGIENECSSMEQVLNLAYLCHMVLQPLRDKFGPIRINSGYRCPELNRAVGGASNSQHLRGEAADIHLPSVDKGLEYLAFLKTLPAVDELIWERKGNTHWIHVSARRKTHPIPPCEGGGSYNRQHRASKTVPLRQAGRGAKRRRGWMIQNGKRKLKTIHPLPPAGYSPLSQGESKLQTDNEY